MISEVLVDALPYIDLGYDDPGVREAVRIICYNLFTCLIYLFTLVFVIILRRLEWLKKNVGDINLQKTT